MDPDRITISIAAPSPMHFDADGSMVRCTGAAHGWPAVVRLYRSHAGCRRLRSGAAAGSAPEVPWRGGIDLDPLDVTDPDACGWLLTPHRPTPSAPEQPDANASKDAAASSSCRNSETRVVTFEGVDADHEPC